MKQCTSAIVTLNDCLSSQIAVMYTIDWKGVASEENDGNRDWIYAAGIIVERVRYSSLLPPAQSRLPVYWPCSYGHSVAVPSIVASYKHNMVLLFAGWVH